MKAKYKSVLIIFGGLLTLYSLSILFITNLSIGVLMPAMLGLPLFFYGIFYDKLKKITSKGLLRAAKMVVILGYLIFFIVFIICFMLINSAASGKDSENADAVIVLGAGLRKDKISKTLKARLDTAFDYLNQNPNAIAVVSGGKGYGETVTEASAMEKYLLELGISQNRIVKEGKSKSTRENFIYSKALLDERFCSGKYKTVFVSNEFHIFRATRNARAVGLEAKGKSSPSPWYLLPCYYLRETTSITRDWLFGWEE